MFLKNFIIGFSSLINFSKKNEKIKITIIRNMAKDRIKNETQKINEFTAMLKNDFERKIGLIVSSSLFLFVFGFMVTQYEAINEWILSFFGLLPTIALFYCLEEAHKIEDYYLNQYKD